MRKCYLWRLNFRTKSWVSQSVNLLDYNCLITIFFKCNVSFTFSRKQLLTSLHPGSAPGVYSVFTHRVSWDGSRNFTTFTIKLFLTIVNGLRSLKIWQGSWIHFKLSLPFTTSYVSHFISFYFERIFKYGPCRYFWLLYREYFECADTKVQILFKI